MSESFGEKLLQWREAKGIKQSEFARLLKLSPTYISNLERNNYPNSKDGKGKPSEKVVGKIAKVLSLPLDVVRLAAGYAPTKEEPDQDFLKSRLGIASLRIQSLGKKSQEKAEVLVESLETLLDKLEAQEQK
jgi:transcriptional regulator with XRE-family HTH domain